MSVLRRAAPWLVPFLLAWSIGAAWAIASPRFSGPDEPAHVRKAAGTVRLQGIGSEIPGAPDWLRSFSVPGGVVQPAPNCFAFDPDQPASCQEYPPLPVGDLLADSSAARYPPLTYAVVGLPSLVVGGYESIYLMRLVQVTVGAAAVALASWLLRRSQAGPWAQVGLLVALTPMVAFLAGVVNPNSVEIVLAVPVWAALVVTVERRGDLGRAETWTIGGVGAALVLTRQLSAVWLVLGTMVLVIAAGWPVVRTVVASRRGRVVIGALTGAAIAQVGWLAAADSLGSVVDPRVAVDDPTSVVVRTVLGNIGTNVIEMIGVFGWLDTPAPAATLAAWFGLLGGLAGAVLWASERRWGLAVLVGLGLVVVVPALLEMKDARVTGYYWQGRYTLPLAVLLPILGAVAVGRGAGGRLPTRVAIGVGSLVAVGHLAAFYVALRRNTVGIDGSPLLRDGWQPPAPSLALLAVVAAAVV
ncbi:MAG: DUF2142 domain-containing protein, partial [Acidimicrobiales bacterium]